MSVKSLNNKTFTVEDRKESGDLRAESIMLEVSVSSVGWWLVVSVQWSLMRPLNPSNDTDLCGTAGSCLTQPDMSSGYKIWAMSAL